MSMIVASRCPKCRGRLVYECVGSYGDAYNIGVKTGIPALHHRCRFHYEHEYTMVYCYECGTNYAHSMRQDGVIVIDPEEVVE